MSTTVTYLPTKIGIYNFTDATGVPLDGKILVLVAGNTDVADLYDREGNPISNPITLTNGHVDGVYMKRTETTEESVTTVTYEDGDAYVYDSDGVNVRTIPNILIEKR